MIKHVKSREISLEGGRIAFEYWNDVMLYIQTEQLKKNKVQLKKSRHHRSIHVSRSSQNMNDSIFNGVNHPAIYLLIFRKKDYYQTIKVRYVKYSQNGLIRRMITEDHDSPIFDSISNTNLYTPYEYLRLKTSICRDTAYAVQDSLQTHQA